MTRATKAKGLPVNHEPSAEFIHSFSRAGLFAAGPSALVTAPELLYLRNVRTPGASRVDWVLPEGCRPGPHGTGQVPFAHPALQQAFRSTIRWYGSSLCTITTDGHYTQASAE